MGPCLVSVLGLKKSGKTTVVEALIAELSRRGYRTGSIKSMVHASFTFDIEGKDTYRHGSAGAEFVIALSSEETVYLERRRTDARPDPERLFPPGVQFVVCEGLEREDAVQVLALRSMDDLEETMDVRGADPKAIVAVSGLVASGRPLPSSPYPVLDVMDPSERRRLTDLVLASAKAPQPASAPGGPLSEDPDWRPGLLPPGVYPEVPETHLEEEDA